MRKAWIIGILVAILLLIGIIAGIWVYQKDNAQDSNIISNTQLAKEEEQKNREVKENSLSTSATQEKVSPNCMLLEKQYFKGCDHIIKTAKDIPEKCINYSKEQFEKAYQDWKIEEFSSNHITVYQEKNGFCNEHYVIRENDGVLSVYNKNENGEESLVENTQIQTMYLPEEDLKRLEQGIEAVGNTQLHSILEDFE